MQLDKNTLIIGGVGVAAIIGLILWDRYRKLKGSGGLVNELGEVVLGVPDETEAVPQDVFSLSESDFAKGPHFAYGLIGEFLEPGMDEVVNRSAYFGSEIDLRVSVKNTKSHPQRVNLFIRGTEIDVNKDPSSRVYLGAVDIPAGKGIILAGSYKIATMFILTGRLTLQLVLQANNEDIGFVQCEVS